MFIFCLCNIKTKGKIYTLMVYIVKVMNLYGVCLVTVLTFPFFTIFFSVLFCHTESDLTRNISCYSGMFYLHFSMAVNQSNLYLLDHWLSLHAPTLDCVPHPAH